MNNEENIPSQLDEPLCPRSCNGRPDNFTMAECILAGECGCTVKGHEYAQSKQQDGPVYQYKYENEKEWREVNHATFQKVSHKPCTQAFRDAWIEPQRRILYTRPQSDELRKAALALLRVLNEGGDRAKAMQELDAALKEQK